MKWITAIHLAPWAAKIDARTALSRLVSDLVRASATKINFFRFPTDDSAQIPGYDGHLSAVGVPPYVPDGESIWEFGVDADYLKKANTDYKTRTETPGTVVPAETTFVFVTPHVWRRSHMSLEKWVRDKCAEKIWKDVRVIDGVALEAWLDERAAVAARFARYEMNLIPPTGARCIAEFWDEYASRFKPALTEQVLLCNREQQAKDLIEQLAGGGPRSILIRADSPDEVVAFAIAAIRSADPELHKFLEARTLILDSPDAARQLAMRPNMIFVPRSQALPLDGLLAQHNPTIVPLGAEGPSRRDATLLTRPPVHVLGKAIETMGIRSDPAYQLARKCGRSITILERLIPSASRSKPVWDNGDRTLIPALLAGGWDSNLTADQEILCELAGVKKYADYEKTLHPFLRFPDPPIDQEGAVWKIRAPVDAFVHLAYLIGRGDLDTLQKIATTVFGEHDPSLDLPADDRAFTLDRKQLKYSEWLREGLATTLLQIAVLHEEAGLKTPGTTPQRFIDDLVENLPGLKQDHRLFASIRYQLPLLMEAAPRPLLSALEHLLEGSGDALRPIFREGGLFAPSSPHTALLWSLEVLAWDPAYLVRVALILAKLAKIDPGGNLGNRPINSLREIFLHWHPATNATLVQRMAALDQVIMREPAIGWDLIVKLLPGFHDTASDTSKPRYREAGGSDREVLTWGHVHQGAREIVDRALHLAGVDPARWCTLIEGVSSFEEPLRLRAYDALESLITSWTPQQRTTIWSALRNEVNRHRQFPEAEWTIKGPEIARLDSIIKTITPDDLLTRVGWLFAEHWPAVPGHDDLRKQDVVEKARANAVREVYDANGEEGLLALADAVPLVHIVAISSTELLPDMEAFDRLIDRALGRGERRDLFARALSRQAERKFERKWTERVAAGRHGGRWTSEQVATLALDWRDEPLTWDLVANMGPEVERSYWSRKNAWLLDGDVTNIETGIRKYISVGRAVTALDVAHDHARHLSLDVVWELLDGALREISAGTTQPTNMFVYHVGEMLDALAKRTDVAMLDIAKREYAYLPLLRHREGGLVLHRLMIEDPSFYVSILSDVFKPASGEPREPTAERKARAEAGYQLLSSFHQLPGEYEGTIDASVLRGWVNNARRLASEQDRAVIADQYIGHTLAHAPHDPEDKAWPHRAVRDVIETLSSKEVEQGILIERHNMRGVYSKAMYEGGVQERALAETTKQWARSATMWPRTAALLHRLSASWEHDARRADEQARQDEMRHM